MKCSLVLMELPLQNVINRYSRLTLAFSLPLLLLTVAMLFGMWNMIGVITGDLGCLIFGAFQIVSGLLVMLIESPCCFVCAEQFSKAADMADSRPLWQRAALYCG